MTGNDIPPDDINVAKDVVFSRHCGQVFVLSDLIELAHSSESEHGTPVLPPPQGCRVFETVNGTRVIEFRQRRLGSGTCFLLLGIVAGFWLGGLILIGAITGSFQSSGGSQLSPTMNTLLGVFGAIFLVLGLASAWIGLFMVAGRQRIHLNGARSSIRAFIGAIPVRNHRVDLSSDTQVEEGFSSWLRLNAQPMMTIKIASPSGYTTINTMVSNFDPEPVQFAVQEMRRHIGTQ